jgi:hypothetical protein
MRLPREKAGSGPEWAANGMAWKGFFLRRGSVFPHSRTMPLKRIGCFPICPGPVFRRLETAGKGDPWLM